VDPLGEALHLMRMDGAFYSLSEFTAPWGLDMPPMPQCLMFHVVTAGRCWLEIEGEERRVLQPGDLALVPHGEGHRLVSEPGGEAMALFDLPREELSERYELLRHGGDGAATNMVCGAVRFEHPAAQHLISLLPKTICIDAWNSDHADWLQSTLRLMAAEAKALRPGGETVVTRLADILVIQAIRAWIAEDPAAKTGWLGALQDPQIGRAILGVHRDPAQLWTVDSLAREAGMSRSAFAAQFKDLVGESPMHYVTRWRMLVATKALHEEDAPLAELAGRLGYQSEAAFSRAFKRFAGVSPGAVRRGRSV
jgi:AraC-like DNA-binding protein/mannose-6-phosphate isomerase-like protein (cupin superfamily)